MYSVLRSNIENYINKWENMGYPNGIPEESDPVLESLNLAPSYRKVCIAIMKNDIHLKSMGMTAPKCKAYMEIKKREIILRGRTKP